MSQSEQSLESLGSKIACLSKSLADQLRSLRHPLPSFEVDAPASLPHDIEAQNVRSDLLETIARLQHLVTGPSDFWFHESMFVSITYSIHRNSHSNECRLLVEPRAPDVRCIQPFQVLGGSAHQRVRQLY